MPFGSSNNQNRLSQSTRTALIEAVQFLRSGLMNSREYQAEINRIIREELIPQGFALVVRDSGRGNVSFVIRASITGEVWEVINLPWE